MQEGKKFDTTYAAEVYGRIKDYAAATFGNAADEVMENPQESEAYKVVKRGVHTVDTLEQLAGKIRRAKTLQQLIEEVHQSTEYISRNSDVQREVDNFNIFLFELSSFTLSLCSFYSAESLQPTTVSIWFNEELEARQSEQRTKMFKIFPELTEKVSQLFAGLVEQQKYNSRSQDVLTRQMFTEEFEGFIKRLAD
ncbi:MAG TPA: hypothetical protein VEA59_06240 [Patescibacteria group bacterium]|nr:hypothetical protein [Patescibacteria group bacterium]